MLAIIQIFKHQLRPHKAIRRLNFCPRPTVSSFHLCLNPSRNSCISEEGNNIFKKTLNGRLSGTLTVKNMRHLEPKTFLAPLNQVTQTFFYFAYLCIWRNYFKLGGQGLTEEVTFKMRLKDMEKPLCKIWRKVTPGSRALGWKKHGLFQEQEEGW